MDIIGTINKSMQKFLTKEDITIDKLKTKSRKFVKHFLHKMEMRVAKKLDYSVNEIALHFYGKGHMIKDETFLYNPLDWAIQGKRLSTVEKYMKETYLIRCKCFLFALERNVFGFTPFSLAIEKGFESFIESTFSVGEDSEILKTWDDADNWGVTSLMLACKKRNYNIFKILMNKVTKPLIDVDKKGNTLFHYAARTEDKRFILDLISNNTTDPKLTNKKNESVLDILQKKCYDEETIEAFEKYSSEFVVCEITSE